MHPAYVNDSEAEASGTGGFLDYLRAGADLYRTVRGDPALPAPPIVVPRAGLAAPVPWHMKPLVWVAAAVLLLGGLILALRK